MSYCRPQKPRLARQLYPPANPLTHGYSFVSSELAAMNVSTVYLVEVDAPNEQWDCMPKQSLFNHL